MADLFGNLSRTERQELCVQRWVDNRLRGTILAATGFGKTRIGLLAIKRFLSKNDKKVIIVVPSEPIKEQWTKELIEWNIFNNCSVKTMFDVSKNTYECSLLVVDEVQRTLAPTIISMYNNIKYKIILCLTATLERLDGKDSYIKKIAPIVDSVNIDEAIKNKWLAPYKEYLVLINPDDINTYKDINKEFLGYFSFFDNNFKLAMQCVTDWKARAALAKERCHGGDFKEINKQVLVNAMGFSRTLQARKKYINNHPRKIELTNLILENRTDKKCITFSATVDMAEKIKYGVVYSGRDTIKKGRITLEDYKTKEYAVINSVSKLNEGFNDPSISVAIILGLNSSQIVSKQRSGRVLRLNRNKEAEIFNLVIKDTVELKWFQNSHPDSNYITIDESQLLPLLKGEEITTKVNKSSNKTTMIFRF